MALLDKIFGTKQRTVSGLRSTEVSEEDVLSTGD